MNTPIHSQQLLVDQNSGRMRKAAIVRSLEMIKAEHPDAVGLEAGLETVFRLSNDTIDLQPNTRLTNMGVPVEWAFVWPGNLLRTTVDVLPGGTARERLRKSMAYCAPFRFPIQQEVAAEIQSWEDRGDRRYGAWLGIRDQVGKPSYKLYAEVPAYRSTQVWSPSWMRINDRLLGAGHTLVMLGLQADTGATEFYYRAKSITKSGLAELLRHFNFPDRSRAMIEAIQLLLRRSIRFEIPSADIGFSVSFNRDYQAESFTLYAFSGSLVGLDQRVRERILDFGQQHAWDLSLYEQLSSSLVYTPYDVNTWHGMVGFTIGQQGPLFFNVGLSPIIAQ